MLDILSWNQNIEFKHLIFNDNDSSFSHLVVQ